MWTAGYNIMVVYMLDFVNVNDVNFENRVCNMPDRMQRYISNICKSTVLIS